MKKVFLTVIMFAIMGISFAQQNTHWVPVGGFLDNMNVVSVVLIDGVEQTSETLELGAFYNDECRGAVIPFEDEGRWWFYLTIGGVTGETFTFRLYDHATQQELNLTCSNEIPFEINGFLGWDDPYEFYFTTPAFHFASSGNWSDPANWHDDTLPGANDMVSIDTDCTLDVDVAVASLTIIDGATLTIQSGKTLTVTGELVNGNEAGLVIKDGGQLINASAGVKATAEKNIIAYGAGNPDGWYTISSPMDGMAIDGSDFPTPHYDLYRFNETRMGGEWENYKDNSNTDFTAFENGRGYLYANNNTFSPAFTGTLNNAAVSYGLTLTDRPNDNLDGFNLIGNPFPHAIYKGAGGAIDNASLASGFYTLTNEGVWHVHTCVDAIMPGQGILVKTTAAGTLNIAKSTTATTAESSSKDIMGKMRMKVGGESGEDQAFVYFGQGIGLEKMSSFNANLPTIYVIDNETHYAIAHVNPEYRSLELGFKNNQSGEFTIGVTVEGMSLDYLRLFDRVTGTYIDLLQHPDYSFTATGQEDEARFELSFMETTGLDDTNEAAPFAFVRNGEIVIMDVETCHGASLQLVDMTGRIVLRRDVARNVSTTGMAPGVYVLRLINGNGVKNQKIVIK